MVKKTRVLKASYFAVILFLTIVMLLVAETHVESFVDYKLPTHITLYYNTLNTIPADNGKQGNKIGFTVLADQEQAPLDSTDPTPTSSPTPSPSPTESPTPQPANPTTTPTPTYSPSPTPSPKPTPAPTAIPYETTEPFPTSAASINTSAVSESSMYPLGAVAAAAIIVVTLLTTFLIGEKTTVHGIGR
jgi:outer membrane biosynthesis protein TonB